MSSIIRKARVLLLLLICWSIGPSYFCGLCLGACRCPDGSLIEAAQGGQFGFTLGLCPLLLAVFIIRQSTVVWVIYEFEKEVVEGRSPAATTAGSSMAPCRIPSV